MPTEMRDLKNSYAILADRRCSGTAECSDEGNSRGIVLGEQRQTTALEVPCHFCYALGII
jgi:hypothetical protein